MGGHRLREWQAGLTVQVHHDIVEWPGWRTRCVCRRTCQLPLPSPASGSRRRSHAALQHGIAHVPWQNHNGDAVNPTFAIAGTGGFAELAEAQGQHDYLETNPVADGFLGGIGDS